MNRQESVNDDPRAIDADLASRLAVLRREHPELQLSTDVLRADERAVVVRAAIVLPGGATASGLAGEASDRPEAYELAESRAVARALLFLGLGAPARARTDAVTREAPPTVAAPQPRGADQPATPELERPAPSIRAAETPGQREVTEPPAARQPAMPATAPAPAVEPDPPMEDFSWTAFWNWARKLGYQNKPAVEAVIGESITSLNPAQVRNLLREKAGLGDQ